MNQQMSRRLIHTTKSTEKKSEPFEIHMQTGGEMLFYVFDASHHNFKPAMRYNVVLIRQDMHTHFCISFNTKWVGLLMGRIWLPLIHTQHRG